MIKPSPLAKRLLEGLSGIEIGGSSHNPFGLQRCWNVDWTADWSVNRSAAQEQRRAGCEPLRVDVVAEGDLLPFRDSSLDYVLSSHVLEHVWDPIGALKDWVRILKPAGVIFAIIPHRDRAGLDAGRPRTPLEELIARHEGRSPRPADREGERGTHHSVWVTYDLCALFDLLGIQLVVAMDEDDKVGNGFCIVGRVKCQPARFPKKGHVSPVPGRDVR